MKTEISEKTEMVGAMNKRRVVMADGRRYLIYYTFENSENAPRFAGESLPEIEAKNSAVEEEI